MYSLTINEAMLVYLHAKILSCNVCVTMILTQSEEKIECLSFDICDLSFPF